MINQISIRQTLFQYVQVMIGATVMGLSYNMFLLPSRLAAGGVSGISTILYEMYGISPALTQFSINIPIFIIGFIMFGKDFSGKTFVGTLFLPLSIWLTADIPFMVQNQILGTLYGGITFGLGLGIVYLGNGSTGGTAALAQILKKLTGLSSGYSLFIVDGCIVIASLIVFNLETTLFALTCIFIKSKTVDFIQSKNKSTKLILIITDEEEKIQPFIQNEIGRGLTKVRSIGGYSKQEKTIILCAVEQTEAVFIKKRLEREDPSSFVIFINTSDILGRGFSIDKYNG